MTLYKIGLKKESDPSGEHYTACFSPYDIQVDAPDLKDAVILIHREIIKEGIKKNDFFKQEIEDETEGEDIEYAYLLIDIAKEFKAQKSSSVRKNVTVPEWMSVRLKELGVDVSGLLQEAATKYFDEHDAKHYRQNIDSVESLKSNVSKEILDKYILERIRDLK